MSNTVLGPRSKIIVLTVILFASESFCIRSLLWNIASILPALTVGAVGRF